MFVRWCPKARPHDAQVDVVLGCLSVNDELRSRSDLRNDVFLPVERHKLDTAPALRSIDRCDHLMDDFAFFRDIPRRRHEDTNATYRLEARDARPRDARSCDFRAGGHVRIPSFAHVGIFLGDGDSKIWPDTPKA